ncbi:MAG: HD domain-containing protein [bacterium]
MFAIWMEFESCKTSEAKIVKQLDKLDAAVQAMEYEKL